MWICECPWSYVDSSILFTAIWVKTVHLKIRWRGIHLIKNENPPKKNERWSRKVLFYFGVRGGIFFFFFLIQLIFVVLFLFFFACEVAFYIKKKISCYLAPGGEGVILAVIENCFSFSLPEYLACILVKGKYLITLIVFQNPKLYTT